MQEVRYGLVNTLFTDYFVICDIQLPQNSLKTQNITQHRKAKTMNLKSFFELENVIFSKEELEAPYENKSKAPYEEKPPQKKKKNEKP